MAGNGKDRWDKLNVILQPVGGLLTALAVAGLGFFGSQFLNQRQALETNSRLYTELMSRREEAESALRKDMFKSIIDSFFNPKSASVEDKVLNLELLSHNFHESLNLKPLFLHMRKQVTSSRSADRRQLMGRLEKVATEITRKQMLVLEGAGTKFDEAIDLAAFQANPGAFLPKENSLTLDAMHRSFRIVVLDLDPKLKEIKVRLGIRTPSGNSGAMEMNEAEFWVGFFDFPMIDNIRLSSDQRCAIILNRFDPSNADLSLVYFPGSYASLKEKPYYHEVVQNLLRANKLMGKN